MVQGVQQGLVLVGTFFGECQESNQIPPDLFMFFRAGHNALGSGVKLVQKSFGCPYILHHTNFSDFSSCG